MPMPAFNLARPAALTGAAALPIAIDLGVSSLKMLQITGGDPPSLVAAACLDTPEELLGDPPARLAFQLKELPKLARSVHFKGRRAACSIPASQMFCKHMQFSKSEASDLQAMVRQAVAEQLGCHPEALLYRHVEVPGAAVGGAAGGAGGAAVANSPGTKVEVICLAVSRELISRMMEALRAAKLEPVGIQPECMTVLRAFDPITRRAADQDLITLYLDLGAGASNVMISHGRELVFAKSIQMGGQALDAVVAAQCKCSTQWARSRRLAAESLVPVEADGAPADGGVRINLKEPLESMTDEVSGCLRYHAAMFPGKRVSRTIFVGGEARQRALCQHIARVLKLPAQVADPMARVGRTGSEPCKGVDLSAPQPGWAVPLGLALSPTDL